MKVNIEHWAAKSRAILDSTVKYGGHVLNRVESTELLRKTIVVYTNEYPITLSMFGTGQISMLNARCLPRHHAEQILYTNIDQTLVNSLHELWNYEIGRLYSVILLQQSPLYTYVTSIL